MSNFENVMFTLLSLSCRQSEEGVESLFSSCGPLTQAWHAICTKKNTPPPSLRRI
jgi:hypothetical protein